MCQVRAVSACRLGCKKRLTATDRSYVPYEKTPDQSYQPYEEKRIASKDTKSNIPVLCALKTTTPTSRVQTNESPLKMQEATYRSNVLSQKNTSNQPAREPQSSASSTSTKPKPRLN